VRLPRAWRRRTPGNDGHSSGPHLHFAVFSTLDGSTRKTIPVEFRTKEGVVTTLEEGERC
jgi:hypothetical protein